MRNCLQTERAHRRPALRPGRHRSINNSYCVTSKNAPSASSSSDGGSYFSVRLTRLRTTNVLRAERTLVRIYFTFVRRRRKKKVYIRTCRVRFSTLYERRFLSCAQNNPARGFSFSVHEKRRHEIWHAYGRETSTCLVRTELRRSAYTTTSYYTNKAKRIFFFFFVHNRFIDPRFVSNTTSMWNGFIFLTGF